MGTWLPPTHPTSCGSPNISKNRLAVSWSSSLVDGNFISNEPERSAIASQTIHRDKETVEIETPNVLGVIRKESSSFRL